MINEQKKEVRVTYIGHSGFMVETERICLWFDVIAQEEDNGEEKFYAAGDMPMLAKEKPLVIFASHAHHDHYCPKIWDLRTQQEQVFYILGSDISLSLGRCKDLGLEKEDLDKALRVFGNRTYELPQFGMKIETLKSTDEGVAFYVTVDGITIFHAGDLNAWYWLEEGEEYVFQMRTNFEKELLALQGRKTDIAFLLLDPRLEGTAYDGIDRYLETMDVTYAFPMHLWKQYDFIQEYKKDRADAPYIDRVQTITKENQIFEILV